MRRLLAFSLMILMLCCLPVTARVDHDSVPIPPSAAYYHGQAIQNLYSYHHTGRTLHNIPRSDFRDSAVKALNQLKLTKKSADTSIEPKGGFFIRMQDGSKELIFIDSEQVYGAKTGKLYQSTKELRTKLIGLSDRGNKESVGNPIWLTYMSVGKITRVSFDAYDASYQNSVLIDSSDKTVIALFRDVMVNLKANPKETVVYQENVCPTTPASLMMLYIRFDTGVTYIMFSFGDDIHIHATDVKEEISYKLLEGQGDELREQMKTIAHKYGTVKPVKFQ